MDKILIKKSWLIYSLGSLAVMVWYFSFGLGGIAMLGVILLATIQVLALITKKTEPINWNVLTMLVWGIVILFLIPITINALFHHNGLFVLAIAYLLAFIWYYQQDSTRAWVENITGDIQAWWQGLEKHPRIGFLFTNLRQILLVLFLVGTFRYLSSQKPGGRSIFGILLFLGLVEVIVYTWSARRKPYSDKAILIDKPHPIAMIAIPLQKYPLCWILLLWIIFHLFLAWGTISGAEINLSGFYRTGIRTGLELWLVLSLPWLFWFGFIWPGWYDTIENGMVKRYIPKMSGLWVDSNPYAIMLDEIGVETGTQSPWGWSKWNIGMKLTLGSQSDPYDPIYVKDSFKAKAWYYKENGKLPS